MFGKKKETPLDKRIKELRKEMEKLDNELQSLRKEDSSSLTTSKRPPAIPPASPIPFKDTPAPDTTSIPSSSAPVSEELPAASASTHLQKNQKTTQIQQPSPDNDLFSYAERKLSFFTDESEISSKENKRKREKFAHYFMAGHFQNLKPLRQERRIMRNKVIMVLIAIAILIAWLLYYFYIM
jgi:hypothetical protein